MAEVAIIYFSATGATAQLAAAAADGVRSEAAPFIYAIKGESIKAGRFVDPELFARLDSVDAMLFGCPTYMGGPAAQFKAFADASSDRWDDSVWADKLAGGFTCGSFPNGDQSHCLTYFTVLAAQHGMLWCNLDQPGKAGPEGRNRLGCQTGVIAQAVEGKVQPEDLEMAFVLGRRVAKLAKRFAR